MKADAEAFRRRIPVRFAHTDPAGILFYPRYFEMVNQVVEDWFGGPLGRSFRRLHLSDRRGTPTVRLEAEFLRPSQLGDELDFELRVLSIGRSSCALAIDASCERELRLRSRVVIVFMDTERHASVPWPPEIRQRMQSFLSES